MPGPLHWRPKPPPIRETLWTVEDVARAFDVPLWMVIVMGEPTAQGLLRYPPDGRYDANGSPGPPCTCLDSCPRPCAGRRCGCPACQESYGDEMSARNE